MTPNAALATPFARLDPQVVLDALDAVGLQGDGRLLQLNSYENRVYQVFLDDGSAVVAKFYRPNRWSDAQILEEHAFCAELNAHEIPVATPLELRPQGGRALSDGIVALAPTLAVFKANDDIAFRFAVSPRRAGRPPELDNPAVLEWIGRLLGRMHEVGAQRDFSHRLSLSVQGMGCAARDWLLAHDSIPLDVCSAWRAAADAALEVAAEAFARVQPCSMIRLHGDSHPGNILWTDAGPHFVDLDDAVNGPAVQDLWMLMGDGRPESSHLRRALLTGYEQFREFDDRELALVEPLRTLRMIHHSAWIAQRWSDPSFPQAFPFFAGSAYWEQQTRELREQVTPATTR